MTVSQCKRRMSSSEFVRWLVWMDRQWDKRTPEHYYLAQIASLVALQYEKKGTSKLASFLLKFTRKRSKPKASIDSERTWLSALFPQEGQAGSK